MGGVDLVYHCVGVGIRAGEVDPVGVGVGERELVHFERINWGVLWLCEVIRTYSP